jgi:hypothetical protein
MSLVDAGAVEVTIPIPTFDGHIVRTGKEYGQGGMNLHITDVIPVSLKVLNLLHGVVIVNADAHIVAAGHEPLLPRDEFGASDGQFGHLKGFDVGSRFVVPNGDVAGVEGGEGPGFGGVNVDGFDSFGGYREFLFDV